MRILNIVLLSLNFLVQSTINAFSKQCILYRQTILIPSYVPTQSHVYVT